MRATNLPQFGIKIAISSARIIGSIKPNQINKRINLEQIDQAILYTNCLEPVVPGVWENELTPLLQRFSIFQEIKSSAKTRSFMAQEKQDTGYQSVRLQILSMDKTEKE